jgi:hypothetical protein
MKFMQQFRTIVLIAKNNGWLYIDPFASYKFTNEKTDRAYLTEEELNVLMKSYKVSFSADTGTHFQVVYHSEPYQIDNNLQFMSDRKAGDFYIVSCYEMPSFNP